MGLNFFHLLALNTRLQLLRKNSPNYYSKDNKFDYILNSVSINLSYIAD